MIVRSWFACFAYYLSDQSASRVVCRVSCLSHVKAKGLHETMGATQSKSSSREFPGGVDETTGKPNGEPDMAEEVANRSAAQQKVHDEGEGVAARLARDEDARGDVGRVLLSPPGLDMSDHEKDHALVLDLMEYFCYSVKV